MVPKELDNLYCRLFEQCVFEKEWANENWFYKLNPSLGCSDNDKQVNGKAKEKISWVESIWTYELYQLFWLSLKQQCKCVFSKIAGL